MTFASIQPVSLLVKTTPELNDVVDLLLRSADIRVQHNDVRAALQIDVVSPLLHHVAPFVE